MHPILFKIGPITLYTYGFFLALGFLVAIMVAGREAKRLGLAEGHFFDLCFYMLIAAIVGSRLLFVLVDPGFFLRNPLKIFAIWEGGLVFHGGLIAALATAFFLMRRYKTAMAAHSRRPGRGHAPGGHLRAHRLLHGGLLLRQAHRCSLGGAVHQP